jgi:hypothetical protein
MRATLYRMLWCRRVLRCRNDSLNTCKSQDPEGSPATSGSNWASIACSFILLPCNSCCAVALGCLHSVSDNSLDPGGNAITDDDVVGLSTMLLLLWRECECQDGSTVGAANGF